MRLFHSPTPRCATFWDPGPAKDETTQELSSTGIGTLPLDLLHDILLDSLSPAAATSGLTTDSACCLVARTAQLARLSSVCRAWRSVLRSTFLGEVAVPDDQLEVFARWARKHKDDAVEVKRVLAVGTMKGMNTQEERVRDALKGILRVCIGLKALALVKVDLQISTLSEKNSLKSLFLFDCLVLDDVSFYRALPPLAAARRPKLTTLRHLTVDGCLFTHRAEEHFLSSLPTSFSVIYRHCAYWDSATWQQQPVESLSSISPKAWPLESALPLADYLASPSTQSTLSALSLTLDPSNTSPRLLDPSSLSAFRQARIETLFLSLDNPRPGNVRWAQLHSEVLIGADVVRTAPSTRDILALVSLLVELFRLDGNAGSGVKEERIFPHLRRVLLPSPPAPRPPSPPLVRSSDSSVEDETAQPEVSDEIACPALSAAPPVDPASVALPDSLPPSPEPEEPDFTLSADIVLLVLDHVASFELEEQANRTLAACCLVSRRMCRLAQPYLHRELRLHLETADSAHNWLQCFDQASLARIRLAVAKPSLISRLSSISIKVDVTCWVLTAESARVWNTFATHLRLHLTLKLPRLPWPVRYWPEGSPHLFDLLLRLVSRLELIDLFDEDLIILAEFPGLRSLSVNGFIGLPSARDIHALPRLLTLESLDCPQPFYTDFIHTLIFLSPAVSSLFLTERWLSFPSLHNLDLSQALCLRTLTIDYTATANTQWSSCTATLICQLDTLLSSSLPLPSSTLSTFPSPFSTFKATLLLPGGDDNLSAVRQAFELSGLPQRIKTDPRLARVKEVQFQAGKVAKS
ncbi:hypothetical protein JCM8097_005855 [Rhodosporidiobolus ruineniae]